MKDLERMRENERAFQEREAARKRARMQRPGWVYVLYDQQIDCYKIGWTRESPRRRLYSIRAASGCDVSLLSWWEGSRSEEAELHRRFASDRHRGEWFHRSPETKKWVNAHPIGPQSPTENDHSKTTLSGCAAGPSSNGRTADFGFLARPFLYSQQPALTVHSHSHEHPPNGAKRARNGPLSPRFSPRPERL